LAIGIVVDDAIVVVENVERWLEHGLEPREAARKAMEEVTGPAASAGVQPGDIILGVNGKRVKTVKELQDEAKASGKNVALLIQREDAQIFVPLRIP